MPSKKIKNKKPEKEPPIPEMAHFKYGSLLPRFSAMGIFFVLSSLLLGLAMAHYAKEKEKTEK